jgi:serine/threonine protein kinase
LTTAYWTSGIIHGDIKPHNILIFEEKSHIRAKVADFGFATCFQGENDLVSMPRSVPWNAPEYHDGRFRPKQAKQMDVYSFGLLCFWLLFKAGTTVDLSLPPDATFEIGQHVNFGQEEPGKNLLQLWKKDSRLADWVCWLVCEARRFDNSLKDRLISFFRFTLAVMPQSRSMDFEQLLGLLVPDR